MAILFMRNGIFWLIENPSTLNSSTCCCEWNCFETGKLTTMLSSCHKHITIHCIEFNGTWINGGMMMLKHNANAFSSSTAPSLLTDYSIIRFYLYRLWNSMLSFMCLFISNFIWNDRIKPLCNAFNPYQCYQTYSHWYKQRLKESVEISHHWHMHWIGKYNMCPVQEKKKLLR